MNDINYEEEVKKVYPSAYVATCRVMLTTHYIAVPNIGRLCADRMRVDFAWQAAYNELKEQVKITHSTPTK